MFSEDFPMSLNFENVFRDGQAQRDGQARPLHFVLSLIVYDDFFGWWVFFLYNN
jgi:hypothetical protein